MELCDVAADNAEGIQWRRSQTYTGMDIQNRRIFGTPGEANTCGSDPIIQFEGVMGTASESDGSYEITLSMSHPAGGATSCDVTVVGMNGSPADDLVFTSPYSVSWITGVEGTSAFTVGIVDDTLNETAESFYFIISNINNGISVQDTFLLTIEPDPNDRPVDRNMILSGIMDDEGAGAPRLVEVWVKDNIADMSKYGLGCANNGGGSDGVEFDFPAIPASKGDTFFITNDSARFAAFFGFGPDFIDNGGFNGALSFNGNDAMELFENGRVIDRYGLPDVNGNGESWEYTNGWAKRNEGTGPDGDNFVEANWTFSGVDAISGASVNDSATSPYPLPKPTAGPSGIFENSRIAELRIYPNPANGWFNVASTESIQTVSVFDLTGQEVYTSTPDAEMEHINSADWKSGLYIVRIINADGAEHAKRIMIE
jgi:hypothetical protein